MGTCWPRSRINATKFAWSSRGCSQAVADEGGIHLRWIKFDHPITSGNHRSGFFGRMSDAAKASPHGADGSRADERSGPKARVSALP